MKLIGLGVVLALSGAVTGQAEWPEFRGPTGQGIAEGKAPKKWGIEDGVEWKVEVEARGWSSPVVSKGLVVMTGALEEDEEYELVVMAHDLKTGDEVWNKKLFTPTEEELSARHAKNSLASSTPIVRDGVVYVHFGHMGTAALELKSGKVIWKKKIEYAPVHGGAVSPILVDGKLVFSTDGKSDPELVALNAKNGKVAWRTARSSSVKRTFSFATCLVVKDGGRDIIVSPASGMVGGYDPKDGKEVWKVEFKEGWSVVPRPVEMDGMIYISTGFQHATALAIKLNGAKGDVTDENVAWKIEKNIPETPSYVAVDGVVYVLSDSGTVTCFDGKSGDIRWKNKVLGNFSSSPTLVDGSLYCQTEDGVCYVLSVSPEKGIVDFEIDLEERVFASPAIVDGAILMRTETRLWKIGG